MSCEYADRQTMEKNIFTFNSGTEERVKLYKK